VASDTMTRQQTRYHRRKKRFTTGKRGEHKHTNFYEKFNEFDDELSMCSEQGITRKPLSCIGDTQVEG